MKIEDAYLYSLIIASLGNVITALEHLFNLNLFNKKGALSWEVSTLSTKINSKGAISKLLAYLFKERNFRALLFLYFINSLLILSLSLCKILFPPLLVVHCICLVILAFRSIYGLDGAYHIDLILSFSICLGVLFGVNSIVSYACAYFVSAQLLLSYFIAGSRKLFSPVWQTGESILLIFRTQVYGHQFVYKMAKKRFIRYAMTWSIILFETLFPLVLFLPLKYSIFFLVFLGTFHFSNAVLMGLNNFFFAFVSAFPIFIFSMIKLEKVKPHSLTFLVHFIVPILLILFMLSNIKKKRRVWFFSLFFTILYILNIYMTGFWPIYNVGFIGTALILSFLLISILMSILSMVKSKKDKEVLKSSNRLGSRVTYTILSLIAIILVWELVQVREGAKFPENALELSSPLEKGFYYISQGGNNVILNHHAKVPAQQFATDIFKLNKLGLRANKLFPSKLSDFVIYETKVIAPIDGEIIDIVKDQLDSEINGENLDHPAGNFILLKPSDTNYGILLAHLKYGSIKIKVGEQVKKGQHLAEVGNSGNSTEPHLHIHSVFLEKNTDYLFTSKAVPLLFDSNYLYRNKFYLASPFLKELSLDE